MTADRHTRAPRMPALVMLLGLAALVALGVWSVRMWTNRTADMGYATDEPVTIEGCLTTGAGSESYVLTTTGVDPLGEVLARSATDVRPTFAYQLVGLDSELESRVGQRVEVSGVIENAVLNEAELDRETASAPPRGADAETGAASGEAQVRTTHEAEIKQRRMQVHSVQTTGEACLEGNLSENTATAADGQ